jgi:hypothetical protein
MSTIAVVSFVVIQAVASPCPITTPPAAAGIVVRAVDQACLPVPGATVLVRGGSRVLKAITDRDGFAVLEAPAGKYTVDAQLEGFKVKPAKNVRVTAGATTPQVQLILRVVITEVIR